MDDLRPGEPFAGCRIDAVAGRGGMGVVYRATELALGRRVALKVVAGQGTADEAFAERFGREVRMAASIDHPNIVPVYGAGEEGGRLYLVMRYVDGTDLHALLRSAGGLEQARAAAIVAQVAAGLDAAHASGLVHRDVKPGNVLLAHSDGTPGHEHVYLTDFGLTIEVSSDTRMTTTGQWIGSVDYMSPEQLRSEPVDARTDVYALGGVLYAALTGEAPFRRVTVPQTIAAHLSDRPPRPTALAAVDPAFDAVVARALAKDPADRYGSAGDLGRAALAAARGERVTIGERVVARGPAAPSDETGKLTADAPTGVVAQQPAVRAKPKRIVPSAANGTAQRPRAVARPGPGAGAGPVAGGAAVARTGGARVRRHHSGSRARVVLALASLCAAGAAVAVLMASGDGERPLSASLSADEIRAAARGFAAAYGDEDAAALSAMLAGNVQRVAPDGAQQGRENVLAVYRRQFAASEVDAYELGDLRVVRGAAGRAAGSYTVTRGARADIRGRVAFGIVREAGRPKIALIATQPE